MYHTLKRQQHIDAAVIQGVCRFSHKTTYLAHIKFREIY